MKAFLNPFLGACIFDIVALDFFSSGKAALRLLGRVHWVNVTVTHGHLDEKGHFRASYASPSNNVTVRAGVLLRLAAYALIRRCRKVAGRPRMIIK